MALQQLAHRCTALLQLLNTNEPIFLALLGADSLAANTAGLKRALGKATGQQRLRATFYALTKAGKTTIVNYLLRRSLLTVSSVPETAAFALVRLTADGPRLYSLVDGSEADLLQLTKGDLLISGTTAQVFQRIEQINAAVRRGDPEAPQAVLVEAPVPEFAGCPAELQQLLDLVDSPGRGEAGSPRIEAIIDAVVRDTDVAVIVFDYTRLHSNEEQAMWCALEALRPELVHGRNDRIIVVVNRFSAQQYGITRDQAREYVAQRIVEYLGPQYAIEPQQIFVTSALEGVIAQYMLNDAAHSDQELNRVALQYFMPADEEATIDQIAGFAWQRLLDRSEMPKLVEAIKRQFIDRAMPLLIESTRADFVRFATAITTLLAASAEVLGQDREQLLANRRALENSVTAIREYLDATLRPYLAQTHASISAKVTEMNDKIRVKFDDQQRRNCARPDPQPFASADAAATYIVSELQQFQQDAETAATAEIQHFARSFSADLTDLQSQVTNIHRPALARLLRPVSAHLETAVLDFNVPTQGIQRAIAEVATIKLADERELEESASLVRKNTFLQKEQRVGTRTMDVSFRFFFFRSTKTIEVPTLTLVDVERINFLVSTRAITKFMFDRMSAKLDCLVQALGQSLTAAIDALQQELVATLDNVLNAALAQQNQATELLDAEAAVKAERLAFIQRTTAEINDLLRLAA